MGKTRSNLPQSTSSSNAETSDPPSPSVQSEPWIIKLLSALISQAGPIALLILLSAPFADQIGPVLREWRMMPTVLNREDPQGQIIATPLVMQGGDPYIRALMRTISASETNYVRPYSILYGGRRISDLSRHPDLCYPIESGPNVGLCTTAAGRYQFITPTWDLVAKQYHPQQAPWWWKQGYSFEPKYQDQVVHDWLADPTAWSGDIPTLLRQQELSTVFKMLSSTWTSLTSGIEENAVTPYLHQIYLDMLAEELAVAQPQP